MDMGSSSFRCAFFDDRGAIIAQTKAKRVYGIRYAPDGGAELSPLALRRAAAVCLAESLRIRRSTASLRNVPIRVVSGCAFWHGLLGLDGAGAPTTPVYTWADSRSAQDAARLRDELIEHEIQQRTGCMLRAPFWPAKLRWLHRTDRALFKRTRRWVSPAAWLVGQIFGQPATSHSMASGTGLYDLRSGTWDAELCERVGVNPQQLGPLDDRTEISRRVAVELRDAAVFTMIGDGAAGNLGSGADIKSRVAINIGTSAAVRLIESARKAPREIPNGLFRYVVDRERMVVGGAISNAGNLRTWCLRELRLTEDEAEHALRRPGAASQALDVLPFWVTERSPTWPDTAGVIAGLTQATTAADVFCAVTVSTFYRLGVILDRLAQYSGGLGEVIVSGGVVRSPATLKLLADAIGRDLRVSPEADASLRGAALYALEHLEETPAPITLGRTIRHDASAATKHLARRERQEQLEAQLTSHSA